MECGHTEGRDKSNRCRVCFRAAHARAMEHPERKEKHAVLMKRLWADGKFDTPSRRLSDARNLAAAHVRLVELEAEGKAKRGTKPGPQHWNPKLGRPYYKYRKHGLSDEDYAALLSDQGGGCAICKKEDPGHGHSKFQVDHDHECCAVYSCGKCVRGLLCGQCNRMLGLARENTDTLRAGADYLERGLHWHPSSSSRPSGSASS